MHGFQNVSMKIDFSYNSVFPWSLYSPFTCVKLMYVETAFKRWTYKEMGLGNLVSL